VFRRRRFREVIRRQLAFFEEGDGDLLDDVDSALARYDGADRDEAEELYGDYVDAVDAAIDILADLRDHFARTLDEPERYADEFNRTVARRLPEFARVSHV
jgi:hypothetical protein